MTTDTLNRSTSLFALALAALRATKHTTPAQLPHWSAASTTERIEEVRAALKQLFEADCSAPTKKGAPNTNAIKRDWAANLDRRLQQATPGTIDADTLELAHRLASVDMSDRFAYDAFVGLAAIANAQALEIARRMLTANVVMHLSCAARVERARRSCESFESAAAKGVSQVIVIGSASEHVFRFDAETGVLTVPAPDSYEHLPAKVIGAMFFFALCGHIDGVLKVDDDHRLEDVTHLAGAFRRVNSKHPVQLGKRNNIGVLGNHLRVWHFGKCADASLNPKPFTLPGTTRWINGANGYFLNKAALRLLFWSHIYFPEYVRIGLYEDMTVSDLLERQGARLVDADMSRILSTVDHY